MFAYCNNNPVNMIDKYGEDAGAITATWSTGAWWITLVDGPLPIGDIVYIGVLAILSLATIVSANAAAGDGIPSGTTLTKTTTYPTMPTTWTITASKSAARDRVKQDRAYNYWAAMRIRNTVVLTYGLTASQARLRVATGGDIMCRNAAGAKYIIFANGYINAVGPEIHGAENYYWHYHPNRSSHTHIWFLT